MEMVRVKLPTAGFQVKLVTDDTGKNIASENIEIDFLDVSKPDRNFGTFLELYFEIKTCYEHNQGL